MSSSSIDFKDSFSMESKSEFTDEYLSYVTSYSENQKMKVPNRRGNLRNREPAIECGSISAENLDLSQGVKVDIMASGLVPNYEKDSPFYDSFNSFKQVATGISRSTIEKLSTSLDEGKMLCSNYVEAYLFQAGVKLNNLSGNLSKLISSNDNDATFNMDSDTIGEIIVPRLHLIVEPISTDGSLLSDILPLYEDGCDNVVSYSIDLVDNKFPSSTRSAIIDEIVNTIGRVVENQTNGIYKTKVHSDVIPSLVSAFGQSVIPFYGKDPVHKGFATHSIYLYSCGNNEKTLSAKQNYTLFNSSKPFPVQISSEYDSKIVNAKSKSIRTNEDGVTFDFKSFVSSLIDTMNDFSVIACDISSVFPITSNNYPSFITLLDEVKGDLPKDVSLYIITDVDSDVTNQVHSPESLLSQAQYSFNTSIHKSEYERYLIDEKRIFESYAHHSQDGSVVDSEQSLMEIISIKDVITWPKFDDRPNEGVIEINDDCFYRDYDSEFKVNLSESYTTTEKSGSSTQIEKFEFVALRKWMEDQNKQFEMCKDVYVNVKLRIVKSTSNYRPDIPNFFPDDVLNDFGLMIPDKVDDPRLWISLYSRTCDDITLSIMVGLSYSGTFAAVYDSQIGKRTAIHQFGIIRTINNVKSDVIPINTLSLMPLLVVWHVCIRVIRTLSYHSKLYDSTPHQSVTVILNSLSGFKVMNNTSFFTHLLLSMKEGSVSLKDIQSISTIHSIDQGNHLKALYNIIKLREKLFSIQSTVA